MGRGWSASDEKRVIELFNARTPASRIGDEFGVSRNAILGLIHRLRERHGEAVVMRQKLKRSCKPARAKVPRKRKTRTEPPAALLKRADLRAKALTPSPVQDPVFFIERQPHQCAWPLWADDADARQIDPGMVCGGPVHSAGDRVSSYCTHHHEVACQPRAGK